MDDLARNAYETLYKEARDRYELRPWIEQATEELRGATGRRLRPDASYLLLVNFGAMVIRPVELTRKLSISEIRESVGIDIRQIVREASRRSKEEEISGHEVINALTNVWADLKTMAYNVWD